jgi:DnaJ-class molecular chaperone
MRCDTCQGSGRIHGKHSQFPDGKTRYEIGPCPECGGNGQVSCCEGASREETMLIVGELCDGSLTFEVNPNDDGS